MRTSLPWVSLGLALAAFGCAPAPPQAEPYFRHGMSTEALKALKGKPDAYQAQPFKDAITDQATGKVVRWVTYNLEMLEYHEDAGAGLKRVKTYSFMNDALQSASETSTVAWGSPKNAAQREAYLRSHPLFQAQKESERKAMLAGKAGIGMPVEALLLAKGGPLFVLPERKPSVELHGDSFVENPALAEDPPREWFYGEGGGILKATIRGGAITELKTASSDEVALVEQHLRKQETAPEPPPETPEQKEALLKGFVWVGMTREQLLEARGLPGERREFELEEPGIRRRVSKFHYDQGMKVPAEIELVDDRLRTTSEIFDPAWHDEAHREGRQAYVRNHPAFSKLPAERQEDIVQGRIFLGMDRDALFTACGKPATRQIFWHSRKRKEGEVYPDEELTYRKPDGARYKVYTDDLKVSLVSEKPETDYKPPTPPQQGALARTGFLGISGQDAAAGGMEIASVVQYSPAEKAGLAAGDRIVRVAGKEIASREAFTTAMAGTKPGDSLEFEILRAGEKKTLTIVLGERP